MSLLEIHLLGKVNCGTFILLQFLCNFRYFVESDNIENAEPEHEIETPLIESKQCSKKGK